MVCTMLQSHIMPAAIVQHATAADPHPCGNAIRGNPVGRGLAVFLVLALCLASVPGAVRAAALDLWPVPGIVGALFDYEVRKGDSVIAISARLAVSDRAIIEDNKLVPPYRLKPGDRLHIRNRHLVPGYLQDGAIINVPQRLIFVFRAGRVAGAYAVALGRRDWQTPTGGYTVRSMEKDKTWIVPPSIQAEMREQGKPVLKRVPPGPDNPLGRYWIGLSLPGYGIHGTNAPSSLYRMRTHGCIRVHPDDIEILYGQLSLHAPVRIIYAHTLLSRLDDGRIVVEVNPDVYNRGGDPLHMLHDMARAQHLEDRIDWALAARIARARQGLAFEVGLAPAGPGGLPQQAQIHKTEVQQWEVGSAMPVPIADASSAVSGCSPWAGSPRVRR